MIYASSPGSRNLHGIGGKRSLNRNGYVLLNKYIFSNDSSFLDNSIEALGPQSRFDCIKYEFYNILPTVNQSWFQCRVTIKGKIVNSADYTTTIEAVTRSGGSGVESYTSEMIFSGAQSTISSIGNTVGWGVSGFCNVYNACKLDLNQNIYSYSFPLTFVAHTTYKESSAGIGMSCMSTGMWYNGTVDGPGTKPDGLQFKMFTAPAGGACNIASGMIKVYGIQ
jgi:hypothetical protein